MKFIRYLLLSFLIQASEVRDPSWFKERMESIDHVISVPVNEQIKTLGSMVSIGADSMDDEQRQVFERARKLLVSIPGHADYFGNEIKRITDEEIAGTKRDYSGKRTRCYRILSQLPTPETAKVLSELLLDERDPWKDQPAGDDGRWLPNSVESVLTLNQLGIKNAPIKRAYFEEPDVKTWQLWFEQVKAGTKTFSFEGDSREYSLRGEVTARSAGARDRKTNTPPDTIDHSASGSRSQGPLIATIAAGALCGLAAWLAWRQKKCQTPLER